MTEFPQFILLLNKPTLKQSQSKVLIFHISFKDTKHFNVTTQKSWQYMCILWLSVCIFL